MTLEEIQAYPIDKFNVGIFGSPASGKTFLSTQIGNGSHRKISTDSYQQYGFEESVYFALEDARNTIGRSMIEGVQVPRLLRKGHEYGNYKVGLIIICERDWGKIVQTYKKERDPNKLKYIQKFHTQNLDILQKHLADLDKKPIVLYWNNPY